MGEANRLRENGIQFKNIRPGEQIQVDLKNATQKVCQNMIADHAETGAYEHICGCKYFIPVIALYTVSALVSPTGQELAAQQPVLVCLECKRPLS
jgi:hypothetical protein